MIEAVRVAIVTALEALEVGDVDDAWLILNSALEDGPAERPHVCRHGCGSSFEWPGLADAHEHRCSARCVTLDDFNTIPSDTPDEPRVWLDETGTLRRAEEATT